MTHTEQAMIQSLLSSAERRFYDVGVQMILDNLPETDQLAVEHLLECPDGILDPYRENLVRYFPFLGSSFAPPERHSVARFEHFDFLAREHASFLRSVEAAIFQAAEPERNRIASRLALLPGIRYEPIQGRPAVLAAADTVVTVFLIDGPATVGRIASQVEELRFRRLVRCRNTGIDGDSHDSSQCFLPLP